MIILYIFFLLTGFSLLIYGANILVDSASAMAKKLNVPNIVIGLTIVAFGTSSPELVVNIFAAVGGKSEMALGNIIGSNIFNILGVLGISALIIPLAVKTKTTWIEIPLSFLSVLVLLVLANDTIIDNDYNSVLSRADGIIFLFFFLIFLVYNIQLIITTDFDEVIQTKDYSLKKSMILIIVGLFLLIVSGKVLVYSASNLARMIGISERIVSLTIISIGTSLPELATSVIAARKKNLDIAIGNIVGSNIFNVFFILGVSSIINPIIVTQASQMDLIVNIIASFMLFVFIFTGKGRKLERWEGISFLLMYLFYLTVLLY